MARAYAATLGMTAFAVLALRGLARGDLASDMLGPGLRALIGFAVIGYFVGAACDRLIRQSVEAEFRESIERLSRGLAERAAHKSGSKH